MTQYPHLDDSTGGARYATPETGWDTKFLRDPPLNNDLTHIHQEPWFHHSYVKPLSVDPGNWDASGPSRDAIHMRTFRWRKWAGESHQDSTGMHSRLPANASTRPNRAQQMGAGKVNLLTISPYRGQAYSDTTIVANGGASVLYPGSSYITPNVTGTWGGRPRG